MRPTQILTKLCHNYKLTTPSYDNKGHVSIEGMTFTGDAEVESEHGKHA